MGKGRSEPSPADQRLRDVRRALALSAISIVWSGVVGGVAIQTALVGGSLALLGFGVDAVIDAVASAALIWRFRIESRQPDRAQLVERAAERVLGIALLALGAVLVVGAVRSLATQSHPSGAEAGVLLLASLVILPALAAAKYVYAGRLRSRALRADSLLTGAAAVLAAISMASLAVTESLGWWWADAVAGLVVAGIVIREGWRSTSLASAAEA